MKKITFLFLLTSLFSFGQDFVDVTGSLPQLSYGFSAFGDYDGDGDMDLFFTGYLNSNNPGGGGLYQNDNGTFNLVSGSGLPQYDLGAADWGDVDGDGDVDLLITGYDEASSTAHADVYINNGDGTFTPANTGIIGIYIGDAQLVDLNNDGKVDIAISGMETTGWTLVTKIYINNGTGTAFDEISTVLPGMNYGRFAFGDYDNDGDMDFVLSGMNDITSSAYTKIWANDGSANFTEQSLNLPQLWLGDDAWGDVDNDGDLDLIITGTPYSDSEAHLLLNDNGSFIDDPHFNILGAHRVANIELQDFNGDGSLDIFITGVNVQGSSENLIAKIYNNNGSGLFNENTNITNLVPVQFGDADAADYDNDGKVDLFITGCSNLGNTCFGTGKLYHNGPVAGIGNVLAGQFAIFPNPAHNIVNIKAKADDFNFSISISDLTGKKIYQQSGSGQLQINVSQLPAGMYLIKVSDDNHSFIKKLIIK